MKKSEFKLYNGVNGKPTYISYKGQIYDVSNSKFWKNGVHMSIHKAGEDQTGFLVAAPHGEEVLDKLEKIGILEDDAENLHRNKMKEKIRDLYRSLHPHPISIHFPIGLIFFGAVLQLLFLISKKTSFENAAFYAFLFGTVFEFPAMATGIFSWWLNYDFAWTSIFKNKLTFSAILLLMSCFVIITRIFIPDISFRADMLSIVYHIIVFSSALVVFILGFYGGKITWH